MRVFDIYQHPDFGTRAVRRGFSWVAFFAPSVWAVRRGLGFTTLLLVFSSTLMFDIAQWLAHWVNNPVSQGLIFVALIVLFGIKPGVAGYRWHSNALKQDKFCYKCTITAESRKQAIRAANDEHYTNSIKIAAA